MKDIHKLSWMQLENLRLQTGWWMQYLNVHYLINQFEKIKIQKIYHKGNVEVDELASKGVEGHEFMLIAP